MRTIVKATAILAAAGMLAGCTPTPSRPASVTFAPSPSVTVAPATPTPTPAVLLTLAGSGNENSQPFTFNGGVDIAYTFDCQSRAGNIVVDLVDGNGVTVDEVGNLGLATSGRDSVSVLPVGAVNPYHLQVISACSWSVTVTP